MKFAEKTMESFLYTPNKSFTIPEFQRPYSWRVENVREYLADLEESIEQDKSHYFGTVVFVLDNIDSSSIIDGQQRVTTSLLMVTAIYHLLKQNDELSAEANITAETIRENYLVNRNQSNRVKLRTVTTDDTIFQKIFDSDGDRNTLTSSEQQSNLFQAYTTFRDYFSTKKELNRYISGLGRFEIVTIALDIRDDNPQRVFESINSTGKPLTDGDKIRNFALMLNDEHTRQYVYEKYWTQIEQSLTAVDKDNITDFFRNYLVSKKQALIKLDSVYPEFKRLFNESVDVDQGREMIDGLYGDITSSLHHYLLLKFGKDSDDAYRIVRDSAFKMRYIQTEIYMPYAMSALRYFDEGDITEDELARIFKLIEVYFSRRIVCGLNTTSVDRFFATLHKEVLVYLDAGESTDYLEVLSYLFLQRTGQTRLPSDKEVAAAVRNNQTYTQRKSHVNYILASIDDLSKESDTLRQIANGNLQLSIEHIMPQTLTEKWQRELDVNGQGEEYVKNVHDTYLHTLANLTLTGYNSSYSNRSFEEKKTIADGFNDSPLKINKWIAARETWNESTLKERQGWWLTSLQKAWPLPETTFQPAKRDVSAYLLDEQDLRGEVIRSIRIFDDQTNVASWSEALDLVAEALYDRHADFFERVFADEFLSKSIKADSTSFTTSAEIYDTGFYIDTGTSTNKKLRVMQAFAKVFPIAREELVAELSAQHSLRRKQERFIRWIEEFNLPYITIDHKRCVRNYLRFTTDTLSNVIPNKGDGTGPWKSGWRYYYEVRSFAGKKSDVQLALSRVSLGEEQANGQAMVHAMLEKDPGEAWWSIPLRWTLEHEDENELKQDLRTILEKEIPHFEARLEEYRKTQDR